MSKVTSRGRGGTPCCSVERHSNSARPKLRRQRGFQAHVSQSYHIVFAGLGATFFSADDLQSETKLSLGFGGGVKYFAWKTIGVRAHFRYKPTMLNDEDAGDFCDSFGFCQGALQQIEFAVGAIVTMEPPRTFSKPTRDISLRTRTSSQCRDGRRTP
jgi:hypothetical protein